MRQWLTVELLFGTLLVTTFTSVGLVALWAATSPRHWFIRTAAAFAVLSPLLFVPAYGPFITFVLCTVLVAVGITVYRMRRRRFNRQTTAAVSSEAQLRPSWQFSVKSALAICTCVAVSSAIVARIPWQTWLDITIPITALSIVVVTLAVAWIVNGTGTLRERAMSAIAMFVVLAACIVKAIEYPDAKLPFNPHAMFGYFSVEQNHIALALMIVALSFAALLITLRMTRSAGFGGLPSAANGKRLKAAGLALIAWMLFIFAPPTLALFALLKPLPVVDTALPIPNGYDELVNIGKRFEKSTIMKELAPDVVDNSKVDAAVPIYAADFTALRRALSMPFRIPVIYDQLADIDTDAMESLRHLSRVLSAKADASMRAGDIDESLNCQCDELRLARSIKHSGLLVHFLLATAIEGSATEGIYRMIPTMKRNHFETSIRYLVDDDEQRERFEKIRERELVWMVKTNGWPNHLGYLLDNLANQGTINYSDKILCRREQTVNRLLQVEMALRAYRSEHDKLPAKLENLVPDYLAHLPDDPFALTSQPLHYSVSNSKVKLWSVGPDGKDDDGTPVPKNEFGGNELNGNGDVILEKYFARDELTNDEKPGQ
jgi:hypothetical protein